MISTRLQQEPDMLYDGQISNWESNAKPEPSRIEMRMEMARVFPNNMPQTPCRMYHIDDAGRTEFTYNHAIKEKHANLRR